MKKFLSRIAHNVAKALITTAFLFGMWEIAGTPEVSPFYAFTLVFVASLITDYTVDRTGA